jgi:nickel/cobalt transporter (NicO) family protein
MRRWLLPALFALLLVIGHPPLHAEAHPLGNFTVNQYSRIDVGRDAVQVRYIVDMAEIPTFQTRQMIDTDSDGQVSDAEQSAYLSKQVAALVGGLHLTANTAPVALSVADQALTFPAGQGGLVTLRLVLNLTAPLTPATAPLALTYRDDNFADRIGWREIIVRPLDGVVLSDSTAPTQDQSDELRAYPQDMLSNPLDMREAHVTITLGAASGTANTTGATVPSSDRATDSFAALIASKELTPPIMLLSLLLAFGLGAAHALTPGHGKTIVAAYLVGSRGTARHAVFLGITTTVTHTLGVFLLGLITLFISRFILPEQLYPWLEFLSGVMVLGIGLLLFRSRLMQFLGRNRAHADHDHDQDHGHDHSHTHDHDHDHGHSHMPPGTNGQPVTWRSLLALGISGGLLPCPSALVVLLSAIALHRVAFGMLLIVAFSIGLAGVLTGIGLLLVYARQFFERFPTDGRLLRALPVASAGIVTMAGVVIAAGALVQAGVLRV